MESGKASVHIVDSSALALSPLPLGEGEGIGALSQSRRLMKALALTPALSQREREKESCIAPMAAIPRRPGEGGEPFLWEPRHRGDGLGFHRWE
jgi:hypothetical protein